MRGECWREEGLSRVAEPGSHSAAAAVATAAPYVTSDQVISTRKRGEMRWRICNGLTHASQYYATTSSSTAEVATLRLLHSLLASLLLPSCCRSPKGDRIPCYMGPESGHRSLFHRYLSKYLSTSRASRLLVETPSYPKGKNIYNIHNYMEK